MALKIIENLLPASQYYPEKTAKDTIYLHHTAGGHIAPNVIDWWKSDNAGRVATAYVIGGMSTKDSNRRYDGAIYRAFPDDCWGHHLGLKTANNTILNKKSVAIEVCNYGFAKLATQGGFISYVNGSIPATQVYELPVAWRGYKFYHRYTPAQLEALRSLIVELANRNNIQIKRKWSVSDFDINADALAGKPGLWMHCNVRKDKWDMHPQPELLDMLNSL